MAVPINAGGGFEYGAAVALFQAPIQDYPTADGYAVAGDGQRFLIRTISKEAKVSPVTVVTNWLAAVKK